MTIKRSFLTAILAVLGAVGIVVLYVLFVSPVRANPSQFMLVSTNFTSTNTNLATTTTATSTAVAVILTPGTATTTLSLDTQGDGTNPVDSLSLMIDLMTTTSPPTLSCDLQHSQDNINWAQNPIVMDYANQTASSSPSIGQVQSFTFPFATSTALRVALGGDSSSTSIRIVNVDIPTRYVRTVCYLPAGSANANLWMEFIGKKQRP